MDCPQCRLVNPPSAQRCDCGYDFETQKVEPPYFRQLASEHGCSWSWTWWVLGLAGIRALASLPREVWVVLGGIAVCVGAVIALLWVRRGSQIKAQATAAATSAGDRRAQRADEFFERYYHDPDPTKVPDALANCIDAGVFQDPANAVWYLFVRIARDHPMLVRRYETLFRSKPAGRPVLAKILLQVGDEQTMELLESYLDDPELEPLREEIRGAIENQPNLMDPLARPVTTPADLDMLWCEFRATGNTEPVLRIIDVLERPDRVRAKLDEWLNETPPGGPFFSLWTLRRRYLARALWRKASILCDLDRREILSPQDLDCHCTMQNLGMSQERIDALSKLLPFSLYGEDRAMLLKASAKWSLASHAFQHPIITDLCKSEAERRTGRCRILLLEITAFAALQGEDLETAFTALGESLNPDPALRRRQSEKADAEWERLARLSPQSAPLSTERAPKVRDTVLRCMEATGASDTYRTKRIVRTTGRDELGPGDVVWECEIARPANLRVFQTMWWEDGEVYDEWISVVGKESYRAPTYTSMPNPDDGLNSTFGVCT